MNPKCKFSREYTKVCLCSVCGGEMCLSLLQNKYSCFCCTCESHIEWSADVKKATIGVPCEKCKQYHTIDITLKNGQTVTGCLQCDLPIKKLSDIKAVFPGEEKRGGRRGRGVYRGRGGFSSRGRGGSHASSRGGSSSRGRGGNTRGRGGRGN
ncbi:hypothetical protein EHI_040950 [Entamoeba histolytica HM-1:IMSS]|uniref:Uncharacterized protein n=2 Tax=Entamoeba TaxID=5758 RepID=B1N5Y4_ENTH1|nr:hypothetical protein EHI_040950 [Entamoeba histolytica HM-1:IMSS]EDS88624.1 hypothetical protein EHI_040950 [Entamoeba histolytica HM-1:IMSS]|eukprot:XP_001914600.1 hypothetical protein EHI_040950 [Entamoeba histolytica HM-1:IMSS]